MPEFTAKDVQRLRQATGAGMMDAKKALTEAGGEFEAAAKWLREKGLAKVANLADRENQQGTIAIGSSGTAAAIVELKSETDYAAKADDFVAATQRLADLVVEKGTDAALADVAETIDALKVSKRENIEIGRIERVEAADGQVVDTYLHKQDGRGVNGVIVVLDGGTPELAHEIAVHAAFTKPRYVRREDVPEAEVADERETLTNITRAEGKPEAALEKIVEGRLTGWFKERVLLEQGYVRDDKQTISQLLGDASLAGFAQLYISA